MDYKINLSDTWRRGGRIYYPGDYRVPEDMTPELAEQALAEAGARRLGEMSKPKRFTGRKRSAPENKDGASSQTDAAGED